MFVCTHIVSDHFALYHYDVATFDVALRLSRMYVADSTIRVYMLYYYEFLPGSSTTNNTPHTMAPPPYYYYRFPASVKTAILSTLTLLMKKAGPSLKPFIPQLHTTFVKASQDSADEVKEQGDEALAAMNELCARLQVSRPGGRQE